MIKFALHVLLLLMIPLAVSAKSEYPQPDRLVVVGDIHGDGRALNHILQGMVVMDADGNWRGGKTVVVVMGDVLDRGLDSRTAMDTLMRLEKQARKAGGRVITLLGNHELMISYGNLTYFAQRDVENYLDFKRRADESPKDTIYRAFSGSSPYGRWIADLPTMVTIGDTLFVHGGVEEWIAKFSPAQINAMMRDWILFFQGRGPRPDPSTLWVVDSAGPVWTRELSTFKVEPEVFTAWLRAAGLSRVVVGHTITESALPTVAYDGKLVMTDTAISHAFGGNLSAIEWVKGQPMRGYVFDRPPFDNGKTLEDYLFRAEDGIDYVPPEPEVEVDLPDLRQAAEALLNQ